MPFERALIHGFRSILFFALFLFVILTGLYFHIPGYVNSKLVSLIPEKTGIREFSCDVRNIGLTGADIASLQIGRGDRIALSIGLIQADYSLKGLWHKHIRKIALNGISLFCGFEEGKFAIQGLDLQKIVSRVQSIPASPEPSQPISVGRIDIRNAVIIFEWKERKFRIPLDLDIIPGNKNWDVLNCALRVYPRGQEIRLAADIRLDQDRVDMTFNAAALDIRRFADFVTPVPELVLSGEADIKGRAVLQLRPFELSSISAACEFQDHGSAYKNVRLGKESRPFRMEIHGNRVFRPVPNSEDPGELDISVSLISLKSPVSLKISDIHCNLKMTQKATESSGSFSLVLPRADKGKFRITSPFQTNGNFFACVSENGKWEFGLTILDKSVFPRNTCEFSVGPLNIISETPKLDILGKGRHDKGTVTCSLLLSNVSAESPFLTIRIPCASLRGNAAVGEGVSADGVLSMSEAQVSASKLKVGGIQARIPLKWPCKDSGPKGKVSVKTLRWDGMDIGSLWGTVRQSMSGFAFDAAHRSALIPGVMLNIKGDDTGLSFASHHETPSDLDLGQFFPAGKGVKVSGKLNIDGDWAFGRDETALRLSTALNQGRVIVEKKGILVDGIDLAVSMPALPDIRSAPKQRFSFKTASLGSLIMDHGETEFQLESDGSLFIERSRVGWCNGTVSVQALRISPGIEEYDPVLYCDRLNLAMVLEQLGTGRAEGNGTVNGRIPVRIRNGNFRFDDALLFSPPGEGGTIHVTGADMLTAGIPKNTPQYSQIDLAREALKDFDYKWATLRLKTQGENLNVAIQFDGKPAKPLPFVYKKEFGGFARVEAGNPGSRFQGIRLDVNLGLPLDEILRYKGVLDMVQ